MGLTLSICEMSSAPVCVILDQSLVNVTTTKKIWRQYDHILFSK